MNHSVFNCGKQYNRVQSGAFNSSCYAVEMRVQVGPTWQLDTIQHVTDETPGHQLDMHVFKSGSASDAIFIACC